MSKKIKCASFFAGIGGIDIAFEMTDLFEVVYANEKDSRAVLTYELNNKKIKVDMRDIKDVMPDEIPDFDVAIAGFPCTDISYAGKKTGFYNADGSVTESGAVFEMLRILKTKQPRAIFLENVAHLVRQHKGETLQILLSALEDIGYTSTYKILEAREYGNTPQHRERVYIVCFKREEDLCNFSFPKPVPLTTTVSDVVDFVRQESKCYYINRKNKGTLYDALLEAATGERNIFYRNRRTKKMNLCKPNMIPAILADATHVPYAETPHGFRILTPTECCIAQTFPEYFILPFELPNCELYKQIGNSVCIEVVRRIALQIASAIK